MSFCGGMRLIKISSEEQPAHQVNLEQQATSPMAFEQSKLKRPSIEPKVVEQKMYEQGALLPGKKAQGRRSYTSLLWWVPLLMFVLLLISVLRTYPNREYNFRISDPSLSTQSEHIHRK